MAAQRPLPSMITATCTPLPRLRPMSKVLCIVKSPGKKRDGSAVAHGLDERFHVVQVCLQRRLAGLRQVKVRTRRAALEALGALHVASLLQLARVHAQVAVR